MDWSCEDWISCLPLVKLGILTFFKMLQIISLYIRQIFVMHYECQSQKLIINGVKSRASKMDGPSCSPRNQPWLIDLVQDHNVQTIPSHPSIYRVHLMVRIPSVRWAWRSMRLNSINLFRTKLQPFSYLIKKYTSISSKKIHMAEF